MPDKYWEDFGKQLKNLPYICSNCGGRTSYPVETGFRCDACRKNPTLPQTATCTGCGETFLPSYRRTQKCPDCVGERSETRPPQTGEKISDGERMSSTE